MNIQKSSAHFCHVCQTPLVSFNPSGQITLEFCNTCGNVWLDPGELASLIGRSVDFPPAAKPLVGVQAENMIQCPSCNENSLVPWNIDSIYFHRCQKCSGILIKLRDTSKLKSLFPAIVTLSKANGVQDALDPLWTQTAIFVDTPRFDKMAIPVALSISMIMESSRFLKLIGWYISMIFHECSHAVTAWLSGFPALPLPYGFTFFSPHRSFLVILMATGLWISCLIYSFNSRSIIISIFFLILMASQIYCSFIIPSDQAHTLVVASGHGGEIIFGAILISAFHYRLPQRLRWDFWRFLALFAGIFVFNQSTIRWLLISGGAQEISWSSAMGDSQHSDLSRLKNIWNWSQIQIVDRYFYLSIFSIFWIVVHYLVFLYRMWKKPQITAA